MRGSTTLGLLAAGLAFCLAAAAAPATERWSQLATPLFEHVSAEHGPPNLATALAQDGDGFLWVGSFGGLARWDGYRLRTYVPDPGRPGALPDTIIQALHADTAGRLWVGTNAHGLLRYERRSDSFTRVAAGPDGLAHVSILSLADDGAGGLWVGSDAGVDHLDSNAKLVARLPAVSLPDPHGRALLRERSGILWIGTGAGLVRRDANGSRIVPMPGALPNPEVASLAQDSAGRIWIGTRGHGAFVLEPASGAVHAATAAGDAHSVANESIYSLAEARPGEMWLGTFGQGIVAIDTDTGATRRMRHSPSIAASLVNDSVWAILRDRSGLVWAATGRGLSRADPRQRAIVSVLHDSQRSAGLGDASVHAVLAAPNGQVWLGTAEHGIEIFDPHAGRVDAIRPDPAHPDTALPSDRVVALAGDGKTVWSGGPRGLYRIDGKTVRRIAIRGHDPTLRINALCVDPTRLWVGTRDQGLWSMAHDGSGQERIGGLSDQRITFLLADSAGMLWVGTRNGLHRIDRSTLEVEPINTAARGQQAAASGYISTLLVDRRGRLWAGTLGNGISVMTGRDADGRPRFEPLGSAQGLPSANISQLLEDRNGRIFASTDNGLAIIDPATWKVRRLHRADGMGVSHAWNGSGAATAEGELLFGGLGGLTVIRPERIAAWDYRPPVVVTDLRLGGKSVAAAEAPYQIEAHANSIAVEFAALDFSAPGQNRYAYQLEGYDKEWIETDATRRLAAYTNLAPGQYTLHLRGSNRDGLWSESDLRLPLRVLPAWHQTALVRAAAVLALLTAAYLLVRRRTATLRRRQGELEGEVAARTAELRARAAELGTANSELTLAADTLRQLGDVGRDITGNLDATALFHALGRHAAMLLDADGIAIFRADGGAAIKLVHGDAPAGLHEHAARSAHERSEFDVLMDGRIVRIAPMITGSRLLGVFAIGSPASAANGERERLIFRTLSAYGAIALANADARAELVRKEKLASLGSLVAGMAHEVNTPLGIIISSISGVGATVDSLRQAAAAGKINKSTLERTTGEANEYVELALRNANRVAAMVDSFKSVVAHRDAERSDVIDLGTYLPQLAAMLRADLEAEGHRVVIDVEPGLTVTTVADALTEALTRVLANVRDHAFSAGQCGTLTLRARPAPGGAVDIIVADDGRGIAEKDLPLVFDPFFTTQSGLFGHAGLGLNVAFNHVTQRLGGTITIDSMPDGGTTVTIRAGTLHPDN